jgi:chemotaxis protein CheX
MVASVDFINPFLHAARQVLASEANTSVARGDISIQNSCYTTSDITVLLNVLGDVEGAVLYSMDIPMALRLVSLILGEPRHEFDELAQSGIAEMGNVITGVASTHLAEAGFSCTISVPTLVIGRGTMLSTLDFRRIVVPLDTDVGEMSIHLSLRQKRGYESGTEGHNGMHVTT